MPLPRFVFRWHNENGDDNVIPADFLATAIKAAQEALRLAGLVVEGLDNRQRARIPADVSARYTLRCEAPRAGSYALPAVVGSEDLAADLAPVESAAALFANALAFADGQDEDPFSDIGFVVRRAFFQAVDQVIPPLGRGWDLEVTLPDARVMNLNDDSHRRIDERRREFDDAEPETEVRTLTGELTKIDFGDRLLTFFYPVDHRELVCTYTDEEEVRLLESRRDQIHVTGRVVLDAQGKPLRVSQVDKIERLDLSPIQVSRLEVDGHVLRTRIPLILQVVQEEEADQQWLTIGTNALGLQTVAATRGQLVDAVRDELRLLWSEFAEEEEQHLTPSGIELKHSLLRTFEEQENAA